MKLAARARDLPALARALEARAGGAGSTHRLVSTYFDTPDRALARQGLTLRVREVDGKFVQTVKSAPDRGGPSLLVRGEWEDVVAGPEPDPQAPETGRFLASEVAGRLASLFHTDVARHTIEFAPTPDTRIEAALDHGHIGVAARDADDPISEVELELKGGCSAALYDVALDLLAVAPLRLERRSKAERGYILAAREAPPVAAVHAAAVAFDPGLSGNEVLQRVGLACLDQILRNEAAVLAGLPEGIHQMRVAVRRLRAVLSAFGRMLPKKQRRWASGELRWLAEQLSAVRNLDVFEQALLAPAQSALGQTPSIGALSAAAVERRKSAYARARKAVRSTNYTALLLRLLRWFEGCGWRDGAASGRLDRPIGCLAARIFDRRRRVMKRRVRGFAGQSPQERHELRIALKKLRYATEVFGALYDRGGVGRFTKRLKRLQDALGDLNDLRVGRDIVAELAKQGADAAAIAGAGAAVLGWHEHRLAQREPRLRRDMERLIEAEPFWRS